MSFARRVILVLVVILAACSDREFLNPSPNATGEVSVAMAAWTPGTGDDCSVAVHNNYSTIGPDGKRYPTWHPPTDPASGCSFGHEHGRDPRGSDLFDKVGPIPFGYANEMLDIWDPTGRRHEDHVGHKVEWENDVVFSAGDGLGGFFSVTCDLLTKLHQGTHSRDAFTNNVHELVYHIRCSDGTEMYTTLMTAIGKPGEFKRSCDGTVVQAGAATPANSPTGGGQRKIPDRECILRHLLVAQGSNSNDHSALHESWETHSQIKRADGHTLASFDPYYQVFLPSRFHDPAMPLATGRPIAACYETEANGDRARGGACQQSTASWSILAMTFDDPRSRFNGARRKVDINGNRINNPDGPNVWYTDPYGRNGSTSPFPGSVRQWIGRINNERAFNFNGPAIGSERVYTGAGTHAPN